MLMESPSGSRLWGLRTNCELLGDEHTRTVEPAGAQAAEAWQFERQLSGLVNEACGLNPDEVALMWKSSQTKGDTQPSQYIGA